MKLIRFIKNSFKDDIIRRVFVKNSFDGVITILGILIVFYLSGFNNNQIIVFSCIGSGVAIGVSGVFGAYLTESAERKLKLKRFEKHLLKSLKGTKLSKKGRNASIIVALFDGVSPLLATIIMILPFFFSVNIQYSFFLSFLIAGLIVVFLGFLISKVNKDKAWKSIIKMLAAGVVVTIILFVIERLQ